MLSSFVYTLFTHDWVANYNLDTFLKFDSWTFSRRCTIGGDLSGCITASGCTSGDHRDLQSVMNSSNLTVGTKLASLQDTYGA